MQMYSLAVSERHLVWTDGTTLEGQYRNYYASLQKPTFAGFPMLIEGLLVGEWLALKRDASFHGTDIGPTDPPDVYGDSILDGWVAEHASKLCREFPYMGRVNPSAERFLVRQMSTAKWTTILWWWMPRSESIDTVHHRCRGLIRS